MNNRSAQTLSLALVVLAMAWTYLPWGWNQNASLSPNARDLAEWTTLYPPYHSENPPLLASLLIRSSVGLVAVVAVHLISVAWLVSKMRLVGGGIAILLVLTLLPPAEYLKDLNNPNYTQMAVVAVGSSIASAVVFALATRLSARKQRLLLAGLCVSSATISILGVQKALLLFDVLGMPLRVGIGAAFFPMTLLVLAFIEVFPRVTAFSR